MFFPKQIIDINHAWAKCYKGDDWLREVWQLKWSSAAATFFMWLKNAWPGRGGWLLDVRFMEYIDMKKSQICNTNKQSSKLITLYLEILNVIISNNILTMTWDIYEQMRLNIDVDVEYFIVCVAEKLWREPKQWCPETIIKTYLPNKGRGLIRLNN